MKESPWRFYPIRLATCSTEEGPKVFYLRDFDRLYRNHFYFWLLLGSGGPALIDTGFDLEEGRRYMPNLEGDPARGPATCLEGLGIDPGAIRHVIITHLHFDHISSCAELYPRAVFYLQRREYETYRSPPHPWFTAFYPKGILEKLEGRLQIIDGDAEILPGLQVLLVGGHTPGLQAVLMETARGKVAMASDLAFQYRNLQDDIPMGLFWNLAEVYRGMERLRGLADLVLPGHDPLLEEHYPLPEGPAAGYK